MATLFNKRIRLFRPRTIWVRRVVQWFFFLLIAAIAVNHTLAESGAAIPFLADASLHAVCPFGGVETLYTFAASGLMVQKIHDSALVLAGIVLLLSVLFGPVFCGWVCPQTVFMEMIFRKIEYWIEGNSGEQRKLDNGPWTAEKIRKKTLKHVVFFTISVIVSNYFLAYIIGTDKVLKIIHLILNIFKMKINGIKSSNKRFQQFSSME